MPMSTIVTLDLSEKIVMYFLSFSMEKTNQTTEAVDAKKKFEEVVDKLKKDMKENGYQELSQWKGHGVGDVILAAKYRFYNQPTLKMASSSGVTLPTGRVADPYILTDIPFGEGNLGVFSSFICDQQFNSKFMINEYVKATVYMPGQKDVRMVTAKESIAVPVDKVSYRTGTKFEAGVSAQVETDMGVTGGFGLVHETKLQDLYYLENKPEVKVTLEKDTDYYANHMVAKIGYSTVPAFKRKEIPVPLMANVEYRKQFMSAQAKAKDLLTVDLALFF